MSINNRKKVIFILQVESGSFLDSDAKIVEKSIRDRVALIKWRRERTVLAGEDQPASKKTQPDRLQVPCGPAAPPPQPPQPPGAAGAADCEAEEDQQNLTICYVVPDNTAPVTCERSVGIGPAAQHTHTHTHIPT